MSVTFQVTLYCSWDSNIKGMFAFSCEHSRGTGDMHARCEVETVAQRLGKISKRIGDKAIHEGCSRFQKTWK